MAAAAASSSSNSSWTYHVYLSFNGEDTRRGFTSHLYNALKQKGIHAFMDDTDIEKGDDISGESFLRAIEASQIVLVIFSPAYASSQDCLDELVKIMECQRRLPQLVIPIFYYVDWSEVRRQRGRYGEAIEQHEKRLGSESDGVMRWREALTAASGITGFSSSAYRSESELVERIVESVLRMLDIEELFVGEHPVRIESQVNELKVDEWFNYDVFLNFRGEDTRRGFTSYLYNTLRQSGIHAFMDDSGLERGEELSSSLVQAIERSQIALVIFSPDYASSRWCLDELVKIMECKKGLAQVVIPIFYEVDPSDVRHQRDRYGKAIEQHEERLGSKGDGVMRWREALTAAANISGFSSSAYRYGKAIEQHEERLGSEGDGVMRWREALTAAANISGFSSSAYRSDSEMIQAIVENVSKRVDTGQLVVAEHPVGIESRVHELTIEWSQKRSEKHLIVGLWGMGGVGKTTIARAIYNTIGRKFRARSFLENIREKSEHTNGQINLQKQLIYDIIKNEVFNIPDINRGKKIIQKRFPKIKAFVVLDDVDSVDQLKASCGSLEWFCPGSVIFITTRDLRLLDAINADHKYPMREMNGMEPLMLFSWHAFKQANPSESFVELSKEVVDYCDGLPLALEILGSCLRGRTIEQWNNALSKLHSIPHKDLQKKLKISYDGLDDDTQRDIFLDICCFFIKKDRNYVTQILDDCKLHAKDGLQILIERSLVKVGRNNKLEMHDLLQEMGKEIVRESSPRDPKKRSRLWFDEDGTEVIQGISLKASETRREHLIDSEAFKKMTELRLLQLDYVNLKGDYNHLSKKLRYSNLKVVWIKPQKLSMLKTLHLSHSPYLTQTPDFSYLPNLERLVMKDCRSLILIHKSIGDLKNLLHVNLKDCKSLKDLPRSIYKLKSVKTLILSGCFLIDHLEEDIEQMESLTTLMADNTGIIKVPFSLARLEGLKHGYVSFPGHEGRAQDIFPSLIWSWMSPDNIPHSRIEEFVQSISSIDISVRQDSGFCGLSPFLGDLVKLRGMWEQCRSRFRFNERMARLLDALYETNFVGFESTRDIPQISHMEASPSCEVHDQVHIARPADSLKSLLIQLGVLDKANVLKEEISQGWKYGGWDDSQLPGDQYPDWFIFKGEGRSVILKVPQVIGCRLKAILLNVVYCSCMDNTMPQLLMSVLIINHTKATVNQLKGDSATFHEDGEWHSIISSFQPGDWVELVLSIGPQFPVKMIAAYLIYDGSKPRRVNFEKRVLNNAYHLQNRFSRKAQ
ncbi:TMV resistance protein N-like [Neltuma alba]|uniref:TMV resistance protein N-like n=1 Tax=Neltuma alba TaxID=207710 RepID=UPI0010A543AC|nr:TMV resistance protein N-like [Prosopis alba]